MNTAVRISAIAASIASTCSAIAERVDSGAVERDRLQAHARSEQALDDVVVQIARDPAAVFDQFEPLAVGAAARELDGDAGLAGEVGRHLEVGVA